MNGLAIIAAMTEERVIGLGGKMPWHLPEDLKHFKVITMGKPVIMGRKTYESLGRPLPDRTNIVITRNPDFQAEGALFVRNLDEAIAEAEKAAGGHPCASGVNNYFVIGGAEIYKLALPKAKRLYLTFIHKKYEGDTYFPEFNLEEDYKIVDKSMHQSIGSEKLSYTFVTAERK